MGRLARDQLSSDKHLGAPHADPALAPFLVLVERDSATLPERLQQINTERLEELCPPIVSR